MKKSTVFIIGGLLLLFTLKVKENLEMTEDAITYGWLTPESGKKFDYLFDKYTEEYNLPKGLLSRVAYQESRYNPNAVSPAGAKGLFQFMDATAEEWGVDQFDPESATDGAARYLRWLYEKTGNWTLALAAYNWGIGRVLRILNSSDSVYSAIDAIEKGAPRETQNYIKMTSDIGIT